MSRELRSKSYLYIIRELRSNCFKNEAEATRAQRASVERSESMVEWFQNGFLNEVRIQVKMQMRYERPSEESGNEGEMNG